MTTIKVTNWENFSPKEKLEIRNVFEQNGFVGIDELSDKGIVTTPDPLDIGEMGPLALAFSMVFKWWDLSLGGKGEEFTLTLIRPVN